MRWVAAALVATVGLLFTACAPPPDDGLQGVASPSLPLPDDAPVVAFSGDSYTLGTGASDPSLRWSTRIAESRGWREFNPSVNGWVRAAAKGIGADHIPGASYWIQGREGEVAADGSHPGDAGHELMARRMDDALRDLGL